MSQTSTDPKLAFLLGWLFGRRRRRRSDLPVLLLLMGILACLTGCPMTVFGTPYSWIRSREVASLPQPEPAQLRTLAPGTSVLVAAQIPPETSAGPYGLALFYVEHRQQDDREKNEEEAAKNNSSWQIEKPPPQKVEMLLKDGAPLLVQVSLKTSFLEAQQFEEQDLENQAEERRYIGYLPGQTLTVEGTWEGNDLLTARAFYAGAPDDYRTFLAHQPGAVLLMGMVCGGLGMGLLGIAGVLRLLGR